MPTRSSEYIRSSFLDEVLADVERRATGAPSLIFTLTDGLRDLRRGSFPSVRALSSASRCRHLLYSAHAPLDCPRHGSTSRSLAPLPSPDRSVCAEYYSGYAWRHRHGRRDPARRLRRCLQQKLEVDRSISPHTPTFSASPVVAGAPRSRRLCRSDRPAAAIPISPATSASATATVA